MHVLLVGNGGREHALAWKLAQGADVSRVSCAPGNPGTAKEPKCHNVDIASDDIDALLGFAKTNAVDLTVVGPEAPLVAGIADRFSAAGLRVFGPGAAAARLEGSKSFAKEFMTRHGIPTAAHATFESESDAVAWLERHGAPIVVKADGLAAGKGVVVAMDIETARAAISGMIGGGQFGQAGRRVVLEAFLEGEEASFIVVVSGQDCIPFASSQDHKRRDDGDKGPNTGGMGAYSPAPVVTDAVHDHVMRDIVRPTVEGLERDGMAFVGFLYVGLMIDAEGQASVVEYNVRLGDPETQPLMIQFDGDLPALLGAAADARLGDDAVAHGIDWLDTSSIGIVLAAGDYPAGGSTGLPISGIDVAEAGGCKVFHAGTRLADTTLETAGGRVICVCASGATLAAAKQQAEAGASAIHFDGMQWRHDIGHRAV